MLIGYARVSTTEQKLDLQKDALEKAGCEKIFTDTISGTKGKDERPGLTKTLEHLRPGDTLVVWKLDRLGRSVPKLVELVNELKGKGVEFICLQDAIDTTTATGKFFFHISAAFAELERNLIRERTMAGLASARARGRMGGRPKAIDQKTFKTALKLYELGDQTAQEICETLGINRRTFYRHLKKHQESANK